MITLRVMPLLSPSCLVRSLLSALLATSLFWGSVETVLAQPEHFGPGGGLHLRVTIYKDYVAPSLNLSMQQHLRHFSLHHGNFEKSLAQMASRQTQQSFAKFLKTPNVANLREYHEQLQGENSQGLEGHRHKVRAALRRADLLRFHGSELASLPPQLDPENNEAKLREAFESELVALGGATARSFFTTPHASEFGRSLYPVVLEAAAAGKEEVKSALQLAELLEQSGKHNAATLLVKESARSLVEEGSEALAVNSATHIYFEEELRMRGDVRDLLVELEEENRDDLRHGDFSFLSSRASQEKVARTFSEHFDGRITPTISNALKVELARSLEIESIRARLTQSPEALDAFSAHTRARLEGLFSKQLVAGLSSPTTIQTVGKRTRAAIGGLSDDLQRNSHLSESQRKLISEQLGFADALLDLGLGLHDPALALVAAKIVESARLLTTKSALDLARLGMSFCPVAGDVLDLSEAVTGRHAFTGAKLSDFERTLAFLGIIIGSRELWENAIKGSRLFANAVFTNGLALARKLEASDPSIERFIDLHASTLVKTKLFNASAEEASLKTARSFFRELRNSKVPLAKRKQLLQSFDKNGLREIVLEKDLTVYRWHDGVRSKGAFVSEDKILNPEAARRILAIPNEHKLTVLEEFRLRKGTKVFKGRVAATVHPGGGSQLYIPGDLDSTLIPQAIVSEVP